MKIFKVVSVMMISFNLMASRGFAGEPEYSGFLEGYYQDLQPVPGGGHKMHWSKPGMVFGRYDKVMVEPVVFSCVDLSDYEGIDPELVKELLNHFNQSIVAAFKDRYTIVADPGDGVARIRIAITGIKATNPAIGVLTSIFPTGLVVNLIKKGTTGSWVGSGSTKLEAEVLDSVTNEVILAAADKRTASFVGRFSRWGSAQNAFKSWSEWMVELLDDGWDMKGPEKMVKEVTGDVLIF